MSSHLTSVFAAERNDGYFSAGCKDMISLSVFTSGCISLDNLGKGPSAKAAAEHLSLILAKLFRSYFFLLWELLILVKICGF